MNFRLIFKMLSLKVQSRLEYKFAFYTDILVQLFAYSVTFVNIWILLRQFNFIGGWNFYEILLLWILNVFSYGISSFFVYGGTRSLEEMVKKGTLDGLLTKPVSVFQNLMLQNISAGFLFHIVFSSSMLIWIIFKLHVHWSVLKVFLFILQCLGGIMIQSSIMIILSSITFWTVKSLSIMDTAIYGLRNFTTYPLDIYNKGISTVLTFIIPYAFVSYYPVIFILDKDKAVFFNFFKYCTPIIGVLMVIISAFIWCKGVKHYEGAGN